MKDDFPLWEVHIKKRDCIPKEYLTPTTRAALYPDRAAVTSVTA